jgi:hypothetical protein
MEEHVNRGLLCQWTNTIYIQLSVLVLFKTNIILRSETSPVGREAYERIHVNFTNYELMLSYLATNT